MQLCDQSPTNAFEVNYDERNPFVVCGESMVPIYRGSAEAWRKYETELEPFIAAWGTDSWD